MKILEKTTKIASPVLLERKPITSRMGPENVSTEANQSFSSSLHHILLSGFYFTSPFTLEFRTVFREPVFSNGKALNLCSEGTWFEARLGQRLY
jgi:hypothetical protein